MGIASGEAGRTENGVELLSLRQQRGTDPQ